MGLVRGVRHADGNWLTHFSSRLRVVDTACDKRGRLQKVNDMGLMRSVVRSWRVVTGVLLVVIGLGLLALPTEWIEARSGSDPGDDGLFELLIGLVPLLLGAGLLVTAALRRQGEAAPRRWLTRKVR